MGSEMCIRDSAGEDPEWRTIWISLRGHLEGGSSVKAFANHLGLSRGVSGYIYHTVAVCLFAWLRHYRDVRPCIEEVILLGGDADTTGAIVGALAGATSGASYIPSEWLRFCEWPRSVGWMRGLAERLNEDSGVRQPLQVFWPGIFLRNLVFVGVLGIHLIRRCLPPY